MPRGKPLDEETIRKLRSRREEGLTYKELVKEFKLGYSTVAKHVSGVKPREKIEVKRPPGKKWWKFWVI